MKGFDESHEKIQGTFGLNLLVPKYLKILKPHIHTYIYIYTLIGQTFNTAVDTQGGEHKLESGPVIKVLITGVVLVHETAH